MSFYDRLKEHEGELIRLHAHLYDRATGGYEPSQGRLLLLVEVSDKPPGEDNYSIWGVEGSGIGHRSEPAVVSVVIDGTLQRVLIRRSWTEFIDPRRSPGAPDPRGEL